jgi:hypothetical protein
MKTLAIVLCSAAVLSIATAVSGFALDGVALFAIGAASVFVGMFASDYSRVPTYNLAPVPARRKVAARRSEAGVEFATIASFDSMVG